MDLVIMATCDSSRVLFTIGGVCQFSRSWILNKNPAPACEHYCF